MEEMPSDVTSNDKLLAALGYPIALIAIVMLFMEDKKSKPFIKFHAVQSIAVNIVLWVLISILSAITIGFGAICLIPLGFILLLWYAYRAYKGEFFTVPVITDFIKKQGWA